MLKVLNSIVASATLLASTTVAAANPAQPKASASQAGARQTLAVQRASDPWFMLSVMSSARSVALGETNSTAQLAQSPTTPPLGSKTGAPAVNGEAISVPIWWALIAIALMVSGNPGGGSVFVGTPNSPA